MRIATLLLFVLFCLDGVCQYEILRFAVDNSTYEPSVEKNYFTSNHSYVDSCFRVCHIQGMDLFWLGSENDLRSYDRNEVFVKIDKSLPMIYSKNTGKYKDESIVEVEIQRFKSKEVQDRYREILLSDLVYNMRFKDAYFNDPFNDSHISERYTVITRSQYVAVLDLYDELKDKVENKDPSISEVYSNYISKVYLIINSKSQT